MSYSARLLSVLGRASGYSDELASARWREIARELATPVVVTRPSRLLLDPLQADEQADYDTAKYEDDWTR